MFSSRFRLKRKTPPNGIERKEFIRLLVDEYYETTNVGKPTHKIQRKNNKILHFLK